MKFKRAPRELNAFSCLHKAVRSFEGSKLQDPVDLR